MPRRPPPDSPARVLTPILDEEGRLADLRVEWDGKSLSLCGRTGPRMEEELAARALADVPRDAQGRPVLLPVLVGLGAGHGLRWLLANVSGPVAVADREEDILALTRDQSLARAPEVFWIGRKEAPDAESAMRILDALLEKTGRSGFAPVIHPAWRRLDPDFCKDLSARLAAHARFWGAAGARRFVTDVPRVLLFDSPYFLVREIREIGRAHV